MRIGGLGLPSQIYPISTSIAASPLGASELHHPFEGISCKSTTKGEVQRDLERDETLIIIRASGKIRFISNMNEQ